MIEILVVIGIIAALTAMLFLGFKHVSKSGRDNQTHVALQNLRGMLTEYETGGGRMDDLNAIYADIVDSASVQMPLPAAPTPPLLTPLRSPVSEDGKERFGEGTIRTQRVMRRLKAVPSVKSIVDNLPPDAVLEVQFQTGVKYLPGDELIAVSQVGGKNQVDYYFCSGTTSTTAAPPGAPWKHMGASGEPPIHHTTVLADGFHNPIWFAPITGLGVEPTSTRPTKNGVNLQYNGKDASGNDIFGSANQTILPPGWQNKVVSGATIKIGRPFFASAGVDGDFSLGDDNHYSFEQ
jgi:type II secretory pathway pseudopilin PulG